MIRTVTATDMYYCRHHVDCVCLCRLVFCGYKSIYRVNVDGTRNRTIVSGFGQPVFALSLYHNNHVCWSQAGKGQRTGLSLAPITYAAQFVERTHQHTDDMFKYNDLSGCHLIFPDI